MAGASGDDYTRSGLLVPEVGAVGTRVAGKRRVERLAADRVHDGRLSIGVTLFWSGTPSVRKSLLDGGLFKLLRMTRLFCVSPFQ